MHVKQAQPLLRLEADIIPVHMMLAMQAYKMKELQNPRCQPPSGHQGCVRMIEWYVCQRSGMWG